MRLHLSLIPQTRCFQVVYGLLLLVHNDVCNLYSIHAGTLPKKRLTSNSNITACLQHPELRQIRILYARLDCIIMHCRLHCLVAQRQYEWCRA